MGIVDLVVLDKHKVARLTVRHGWTRSDLAKAAGISPCPIAAIFKCKPIGPPTAKKIADALGVTIEELIDEQAKSKKDVQSLRHEPVAAPVP